MEIESQPIVLCVWSRHLEEEEKDEERMGEEKKLDIDSFSVGPLPSIFYVPCFLTPSEQTYFLHQVRLVHFRLSC